MEINDNIENNDEHECLIKCKTNPPRAFSVPPPAKKLKKTICNCLTKYHMIPSNETPSRECLRVHHPRKYATRLQMPWWRSGRASSSLAQRNIWLVIWRSWSWMQRVSFRAF